MIDYTRGVWEVEYTNEFGDWWDTLAMGQQEALDDRICLLADHGPALKRPVIGAIAGSRHNNMKELRASAGGGSLRVLFAFDPRRQVILLLGGDKSGQWDKWYEWAIPAADRLYHIYLQELRHEGLI